MDNHLMIFESADFGRVRSVLKDELLGLLRLMCAKLSD